MRRRTQTTHSNAVNPQIFRRISFELSYTAKSGLHRFINGWKKIFFFPPNLVDFSSC